MNYFSFHIGDYAVHTRHLSLLEDLAYRRLLDLYYTHDGDIPSETQSVARLIGMREQIAEVETVLREFFTQDGCGKWSHARCDEEIAKARAAAERARTNGKAGGRPAGTRKEPSMNPAETQPVSSGNPEESKSKAPITHYPITSVPNGTGTAGAAPDSADMIFSLGLPMLIAASVPEKSARSMLGLMRKTHGDGHLIDAIARMAEEKPLQPVAWLQAALKAKAKVAGKHAGFQSKDYRQGVLEDGSIAA